MLTALKAAGLRTAILSNGSPTMLTGAVNSAGIGPLLDAVLSVDTVQIYKPHPKVYQLMVDHFGIAKEAICFMSSNAWDAVGAAAFGCRVVWVNRAAQGREALPAQPDAEIKTLAELPALLGIAG
jgi:2-haloacid dehalogenase